MHILGLGGAMLMHPAVRFMHYKVLKRLDNKPGKSKNNSPWAVQQSNLSGDDNYVLCLRPGLLFNG